MKKQVIQPDGVPKPPLHYSTAIKVDDWIFVSGQLASDFQSAIAPAARTSPDLPFHGSPTKLQTRYLFDNLSTILASAGSSLDQIVRIDQFTSSRDCVHPYLEVRNELLKGVRPVSTALQVESLVVPDALIQVDAIALTTGSAHGRTSLTTDKVSRPPAGYSLAISAGSMIFASGATPTDYKSGGAWPGGPGTGLAEEARVDPNYWFGSEIKKQTAYVVEKLAKYLAAGGASITDIVKAQVYLAETADHFAFQEAWRDAMGSHRAALTVLPVKGMSTVGGRVEINLVAAVPNRHAPAVIQSSRAPKSLSGEPHAVKLGNILFISGQMACDERGAVDGPHSDNGLRYLSSSAKRQMEVILKNTQAICEAAGGGLDSIVRAQLFYTNLADVVPSFEVWKDAFPAAPPAATFVRVPNVLPVPGCTVLADFIAWIP
jgi:enamine deaminase RidA (YjgF/YER057c/UK114 family)